MKSNETVLPEADTTRSLKMNTKMPGKLFWLCDEKRETRISRDNWND